MNPGITGIILAGGQSRRMGANKAFVRLNGKPLIGYALDALQKLTPEIILSVGAEPFQYENLPVVKDIYPGCGPAGGILSALRHSKTELNFVLSCDMPFVSGRLLKYILDQVLGNPADVTLPVDENGQWQTLCAIYSKNVVPRFEKAVLKRQLKLKGIISKTDYKLLAIEKEHDFYHPNSFLNVNSPDELSQSEALWLTI